MTISALPAIAALVRAGAVERGWALFEAGGHLERSDDPAALAVKGRLLKARARQAGPGERNQLFADAATAYAAACALDPAPYLAINAASLSLLAGKSAAAETRAREVLALLDAPEGQADTPYYLAATRAEALLLIGDRDGAEAALDQAVAHDPDGWDDRATTIAQLREIAAAQNADAGWLDRFAPPASLHFAGHMALVAGGPGEAELAAAVDRLLASGRIGFGWGALAAGADIVIAERLLTAGAELHVVLPCPAADFRAQSVAPAGAEWADRFDRVLDAAISLRIAAPGATSVHDPLATAFAGELAIGGALLNAARLGASAAQLIACDEQGGGRNTARQAEMWRAPMGDQIRISIPREVALEQLFAPEEPDPARRLAVHVAIAIDALARTEGWTSEDIAGLADLVGETLAILPGGSVRVSPGLWEFALEDLALAQRALARLVSATPRFGANPPAIGVHLAIAPLLVDPASGTMLAYGNEPALARSLAARALPGMALGSAPFAIALAVRPPGPLRSELYLPDEPQFGGAVHLLLPKVQ